jgi:hypothetical protein
MEKKKEPSRDLDVFSSFSRELSVMFQMYFVPV